MENFVFLSSWYDVIKAYEDTGQKDVANAIAKEIITYGVTGDTTTTDPLISGIVRGMCTAQIKKPNARGGRPPKYDKSEIIALCQQKKSEDVAKQLGCSVKTVQRALAADYDI